MASNCVKCSGPVKCEDMLICSGLCNKVAHFKCAGFRKNVYDVICGSDNIRWFCDVCKDNYKLHINKITELTELVNNIVKNIVPLNCVSKCVDVGNHNTIDISLMSDLPIVSAPMQSGLSISSRSNDNDAVPVTVTADMGLVLNTFSDSTDSDVPTANSNAIVEVPNSSKGVSHTLVFSPVKIAPLLSDLCTTNDSSSNSTTLKSKPSNAQTTVRRTDVESCSNSLTKMNKLDDSSASSFIKSKFKRNKIPDNVIIGSVVDCSLRTVAPRKHLFISRLHPDVSVEDINDYLTTKFNLIDAKIIRFNPNTIQDYASFKITVLESQFTKLMNSDAWPVGVLIKEYQYKSKSRPFLGLSQQIKEVVS